MIRATLTKIQNHSAKTTAQIASIDERSVRDRTSFADASKVKIATP
jgi:hypothetical protein